MRIIKKVGFIITKLFPKKRKRIIFGSWAGEKFADNAKYLYLYCLEYTDLDVYWVTKNEKIYNELKNEGYPVLKSNTLKSFKKHSTAFAYFWTSFNDSDVDEHWLGGAKSFNLFHGVGPKKVGNSDDKANASNAINNSGIKEFLKKIIKNDSYLFTTSEDFKELYSFSLDVPIDKVYAVNSQSRNDVFFNDSLEYVLDKSPYDPSKKTILYMPTHRKEGREIFNLEKIMDLHELNSYCKENNLQFVINKHFYHLNEKVDIDNYENIIDVTKEKYDTQILLKYADVLITDYSSCYVDFLVTRKPIIFYCYDIDDYQINDRDFYYPYNDITPGEKITTFEDLLKGISTSNRDMLKFREDYNYSIETFFGKKINTNVSENIIGVVKEIMEGKL